MIFNISYAYNIVSPTREFYVNDYANVLNTETKEYIINLNKQYEQTNEKPQVVVVTVKTLDNLSMEEYSVKLFEKFKIGNAKLDNGVLIILAPNERKIRIEVGYGLEGAIPDSVAGSIIGTLVGGSSTIGTAQLAFTYGFSAWWFTLGGGIGCLILALGFAKPLYNSGISTLPQVFSREYDQTSSTVATVLMSIGSFLSIVAQVLAGIALVTSVSYLGPTTATICIILLMLAFL